VSTDPNTPTTDLRRSIYEEAACICEAQMQVFLSPQYAIGQPLSSLSERMGCAACAREIRKAGGIDDPHT
jgi:hypothetical protein